MAVAFLASLALGCRQGSPTTAATEDSSPACTAVLTAAARGPRLASFDVLLAGARARGAESDVARLAAASCPLAWVSALDGPDAPLARRVLERCADAEAPLALVCARRGQLGTEDTHAVVGWAARHPLARDEDGPSLRAVANELDRARGPQEAVDAIARVTYPRR
jgi:hypothetical protein